MLALETGQIGMRVLIGSVLLAMLQTASAALPRPEHVVIVVEENQGYEQIVGSPNAPYINGTLIPQGGLLADYHALHHPSQPNYLELFAGSAQGTINDDLPTAPFNGPSLGGVLDDHALSFVGYAEDMPAGCKGLLCGDAGAFVTRHCPWLYFRDVADGFARSMAAFPPDFGELPTMAFVIPNVLDDMHGVRGLHRNYVRAGDAWLKERLDPYVQWATAHNSLLIVTWDEDGSHYDMPPPPAEGIRTSGSLNRVPLIVVGGMVKSGATNDQHYDHLDLLRTLEDFYGLPHLRDSEHGKDINGVWIDH